MTLGIWIDQGKPTCLCDWVLNLIGLAVESKWLETSNRFSRKEDWAKQKITSVT